jgi:hypothetical protein
MNFFLLKIILLSCKLCFMFKLTLLVMRIGLKTCVLCLCTPLLYEIILYLFHHMIEAQGYPLPYRYKQAAAVDAVKLATSYELLTPIFPAVVVISEPRMQRDHNTILNRYVFIVSCYTTATAVPTSTIQTIAPPPTVPSSTLAPPLLPSWAVVVVFHCYLDYLRPHELDTTITKLATELVQHTQALRHQQCAVHYRLVVSTPHIDAIQDQVSFDLIYSNVALSPDCWCTRNITFIPHACIRLCEGGFNEE